MFHEMTLKLYFMKCLERKISQCILPFIFSQKKVFLIFQETELSYISGNRTFLYFFKKRFLLYVGKGIFRTPAYIELEAYSELWYIRNPNIFRIRNIFRTRGIFGTLSNIYDETLSKNSCLAHLPASALFS